MFKKKGLRVNSVIASQTKPKEQVLRQDIPCGIDHCELCSGSHNHRPLDINGTPIPGLDPSQHIMLPDTNVIIHNINALEDQRLKNICLLTTVLDETRNRNSSVYVRVQRLISDPEKRCVVLPNTNLESTHCVQKSGETNNDYNDRQIRVAAGWLSRHAAELCNLRHMQQPGVALVTYDKNLRDICAAEHQKTMKGQQEIGEGKSNKEEEKEKKEGISPADMTIQQPNYFQYVTPHEYIRKSLELGDNTDLLEKLKFELPEGMKEHVGAQHFVGYLAESELRQGVEGGTYFKGKLRVSENSCFYGEIRGSFEVPKSQMVSALDEGHSGESEDVSSSGRTQSFSRIIVAGKYCFNRAIHDDVVVVQLLPVEQWRNPNEKKPKAATEGLLPEGVSPTSTPPPKSAGNNEKQGILPLSRVVGILEMNRRPYCGSIDVTEVERAEGSDGAVSVLFQPKSSRIPRIRIRTRHLQEIKNKRITVVLDDWQPHNSVPLGHYIDILGDIGDAKTERQVILIEREIPHYDFSKAVLDCLPKGDWSVEPEEEAKRLDLRDMYVCSVDPLGCKDIDDALHCRQLPNGHVEVGVHIADVSHFVKEGTSLDLEAKNRGTSVYLVDKRIDMLPKLLTENLCSIVENEDRYAFSILWEFESVHSTKVIRAWHGKTIIRSRAALYYGDAQKMIDDPNDQSELAKSLRGLMSLSKLFLAERKKAGALILSQQQFIFKVESDHQDPTDMAKYQQFEANSMIEEWMLFANVASAKKIQECFPQWALLRNHVPPDEHSFDDLNAALKEKVGWNLDTSTSLSLSQSLVKAVDPSDPFFSELVRMLVTRCLRQAQYVCSGEIPYDQYLHYGLATPIYTHFTSPIRRYPDLIVHRQLGAALGILQVSSTHTDKEQMNLIANNCNLRHENAQKASRDSRNLYTGFYLRRLGKIPVQPGYVLKVDESYVSVLVVKHGQEGRIPRERLKKKNYKMFDKVMIQIELTKEGDILKTKLEFNILEAIEAKKVEEISETQEELEEEKEIAEKILQEAEAAKLQGDKEEVNGERNSTHSMGEGRKRKRSQSPSQDDDQSLVNTASQKTKSKKK